MKYYSFSFDIQVYAHMWSDGLWWKKVLHVYESIMVFCLFLLLCEVGLMLCSFVESTAWVRFCIIRKEGYVSWVMVYVSWVMICQRNGRIREDNVCVLLEKGMWKRIMRSNRRGTWGYLNLPLWLSTSCMISFYCFWSMRFTNPLYIRW